jgi:hypothetical protein
MIGFYEFFYLRIIFSKMAGIPTFSASWGFSVDLRPELRLRFRLRSKLPCRKILSQISTGRLEYKEYLKDYEFFVPSIIDSTYFNTYLQSS